MKTGRTAALHELPKADEPDIMYLEETPATLAKKKLTSDEVARIVAENGHRFHVKGQIRGIKVSAVTAINRASGQPARR